MEIYRIAIDEKCLTDSKAEGKLKGSNKEADGGIVFKNLQENHKIMKRNQTFESRTETCFELSCHQGGHQNNQSTTRLSSKMYHGFHSVV